MCRTFFFQELIKDQVANMYLWPKTLEVPIIDPTKYVSDALQIISIGNCSVSLLILYYFQSAEKADRNCPCESCEGNEAKKERFYGGL